MGQCIVAPNKSQTLRQSFISLSLSLAQLGPSSLPLPLAKPEGNRTADWRCDAKLDYPASFSISNTQNQQLEAYIWPNYMQLTTNYCTQTPELDDMFGSSIGPQPTNQPASQPAIALSRLSLAVTLSAAHVTGASLSQLVSKQANKP